MSAAVASAAAANRRLTRQSSTKTARGEPLSFHLTFLLGRDYELPEGKNSVHVLREPFFGSEVDDSPFHNSDLSSRLCCIGKSMFRGSSTNITGTRMEFWTNKFNSVCTIPSFENSWQDRLVVVTERRIFIITRKLDSESDDVPTSISSLYEKDSRLLEIVDSIPMEEIASVQLEDDAPDDDEGESRNGQSENRVGSFTHGGRLSSYILSASNLLHKSPPAPEDPNTTASIPHGLRESLSTPAAHSARELFCPSLLRISTSPGGFNHGQTYHLLVRRDGHRQLDKSGEEVPAASDDADWLARCISALAERRRREHASETRFARMQQRLQAVWDSVPFNVAVLALITSNFVITVEQVLRPCHVGGHVGSHCGQVSFLYETRRSPGLERWINYLFRWTAHGMQRATHFLARLIKT
jgi:hypothetical protein